MFKGAVQDLQRWMQSIEREVLSDYRFHNAGIRLRTLEDHEGLEIEAEDYRCGYRYTRTWTLPGEAFEEGWHLNTIRDYLLAQNPEWYG